MKNMILFVFLSIVLSLSAHAERLLSGYPKEDLTFPESLDGLQSLQVLSGGTGGVLVLQDPKTNSKYTLKSTSDVDHFKEEILTDALYRALEVDVPDFALYNELPANFDSKSLALNKKGIFRLARFKDPHGKSGDNDKKEFVRKQIKKNFIADAYLSNWDIVEDLKNVVLDKNSRLWRVDNGGGLRYRAKGVKKEKGKKWEPESVTELDTMRDANINKDGAAIYANISENEIKVQVRQLFRKAPELFTALNELNRVLNIKDLDDLKNNLLGRLHDLQTKYMAELQPGEVYLADPYLPAVESKTSAGMFIISEHNGEKVVLLGKRIRHNWFGNLGGKSDKEDKFLYKTAAREVYEESMKLIKVTPEELLNSPSHDFINGSHLFRTYFVNHHFIEAKHFNKALKDSNKAEEYTEFKWVSLDRFIDAVMHGTFIKEESEWTVKVDEETILHAPLFNSSREMPCLDLLSQINTGKKLARSVTQSRFSGYPATGPQFLNQALAPKLRVFWAQPTTIEHMKGARLVKVGDHVRVEKRTRDNHAVKQQITEAIVNKGEVNVEIADYVKAKRARLDAETAPAQSSSSTSSDGTSYTQTEAFLKIVEGDQYDHKRSSAKKVNDYLVNRAQFCKDRDVNDTYESTLTKALAAESAHKDKLVFYHATMPCFAFMYDLYKEFRRQITMQKGENWAALRATDSKFAKFDNATDFYAYFKNASTGAGLNYGSKDGYSYQEMGLSTNPFLFGNDGNSTSATYYLFYASESVSPPSVEELFKKFAAEVGLKTDYNRYVDLYNRYYETKYENLTKSSFLDDSKKRNSAIAKNGRLYQIFIDPKVADTVAYMAKSGGRTIIFKNVPGHKEDYSGTKDLLGLLKKEPLKFNDLLRTAHYCDSASNPSLHDVQTRIFLKPQVMYSDAVQVNAYWRHPLKDRHFETYKNRLHNVVKSDVIEWLKEGVSAGIETYSGVASPTKNESMLAKRKTVSDDDDNVLPTATKKKKKQIRKRKADDLPTSDSASSSRASSSTSDFDRSDAHLPKLQRLYKKVVEGVLKEETTLSLSLLPTHVIRGEVDTVDELLENSNKRINELYSHPTDPSKRVHLLALVPAGHAQMAWTLYAHGASLANVKAGTLEQEDLTKINKNFRAILAEYHQPAGKNLQIVEDAPEVADRLLEEFFSDADTYGANMLRDQDVRAGLVNLFEILVLNKMTTQANDYVSEFAKVTDQALYNEVMNNLVARAVASKDKAFTEWAIGIAPDSVSGESVLKAIIEHSNESALIPWEKKYGKSIANKELNAIMDSSLLLKNKALTEKIFTLLLKNGVKASELYGKVGHLCLKGATEPKMLEWFERWYVGFKGVETLSPLEHTLNHLKTTLASTLDVSAIAVVLNINLKHADKQSIPSFARVNKVLQDLIKVKLSSEVVGLCGLLEVLLKAGFTFTDEKFAAHHVLGEVMMNWGSAPLARQTVLAAIDCGAGYYNVEGVVYPLHQLGSLSPADLTASLYSLSKTNPKSYALQHALLTAQRKQDVLPKVTPELLSTAEVAGLYIQQHMAVELDALLTKNKMDLKNPLPNYVYDSVKESTCAQTCSAVSMARGDLKTLMVLIKHGASLKDVALYTKLCDEKREEIKKLTPDEFFMLVNSGLPLSKDFISYAIVRLLSPDYDANHAEKTWGSLEQNVREQYSSPSDIYLGFLKESLVTIEKKNIASLREKIHKMVAKIFEVSNQTVPSKDILFNAIRQNNLAEFESKLRLPALRSTLRELTPSFLEEAVKAKAYAIIEKLKPSVVNDRYVNQLLDACINNAALDTFKYYFGDAKFNMKGHVNLAKVNTQLADALAKNKITKDQYDAFDKFLKENFSK